MWPRGHSALVNAAELALLAAECCGPACVALFFYIQMEGANQS
jgi:hypothetical protein